MCEVRGMLVLMLIVYEQCKHASDKSQGVLYTLAFGLSGERPCNVSRALVMRADGQHTRHRLVSCCEHRSPSVGLWRVWLVAPSAYR
jgi:hypothetical protein